MSAAAAKWRLWLLVLKKRNDSFTFSANLDRAKNLLFFPSKRSFRLDCTLLGGVVVVSVGDVVSGCDVAGAGDFRLAAFLRFSSSFCFLISADRSSTSDMAGVKRVGVKFCHLGKKNERKRHISIS